MADRAGAGRRPKREDPAPDPAAVARWRQNFSDDDVSGVAADADGSQSGPEAAG